MNTLRKIASYFGIPVSVFLVAGRGGGTSENAAEFVESDLETIWKKLEGVKALEERLGKLEALLDRVERYCRENSKGTLIDFRVSFTGDDIAILCTHELGEENEKAHKLAWDTFVAGTELAR